MPYYLFFKSVLIYCVVFLSNNTITMQELQYWLQLYWSKIESKIVAQYY